MAYMKFTVEKLPMYNDWASAVAIGPIIWIKKTEKDNKGLLEHEKFHVSMFWCWFFSILFIIALGLYASGFPHLWFIGEVVLGFAVMGTRTLLYAYVDSYRLWEEVKAYAIQHHTNSEDESKLEFYAEALTKYYRLSITKEDALKRLRNETEKLNR